MKFQNFHINLPTSYAALFVKTKLELQKIRGKFIEKVFGGRRNFNFFLFLNNFFCSKNSQNSSSFVKDRFYSIDGLRGYLAIFVFLHHCAIFYFYIQTGFWKVPPSAFFTNIGQGSVALFFMITAFLFFSKILRSDSKIDWKQLFLSRFLRLCPLYFFVMLGFFFIVAVLSNFELKESWLKILYQTVSWLGFGIIDMPNINKVGITKISSLVSVVWTLKYEWFFYFSLPCLAAIIRKKVDKKYLVASLLISSLLLKNLDLFFLLPFFIGILSALIALNSDFCSFAKSKIASTVVLIAIFFVMFFCKTSYGVKPTILLGLAFVLIACGNDLFGLFQQKFSQILGQISYSIYLLHLIFLFVTFYFIFGFEKSALFSLPQYYLIIAAITPFLLLGSFGSFHLIEKRFMTKK